MRFPPRAAQVSDQLHCYALAPSQDFFLKPPSLNGAEHPLPAPHFCAGNKSRLERTASRLSSNAIRAAKSDRRRSKPGDSPSSRKNELAARLQNSKDFAERERGDIWFQFARNPDSGVDRRGRSREVEQGTVFKPVNDAVTGAPGRGGLSAHTITSLPSKTLSGNAEPISRRQIIKDQQNSTCGVTAQEGLRRRDRFGQRRRRGSRFGYDQLRGEASPTPR